VGLLAETTAIRTTLLGQVGRFILVGVLAAVIDFGVYHLALELGVWIHAARALGFLVATSVAYVLNRRWVFHVTSSLARRIGFALLYVTTFFMIMAIHAIALGVLPLAWWAPSLAWAVSQGVGSACNFVVLRKVVFRS